MQRTIFLVDESPLRLKKLLATFIFFEQLHRLKGTDMIRSIRFFYEYNFSNF